MRTSIKVEHLAVWCSGAPGVCLHYAKKASSSTLAKRFLLLISLRRVTRPSPCKPPFTVRRSFTDREPSIESSMSIPTISLQVQWGQCERDTKKKFSCDPQVCLSTWNVYDHYSQKDASMVCFLSEEHMKHNFTSEQTTSSETDSFGLMRPRWRCLIKNKLSVSP